MPNETKDLPSAPRQEYTNAAPDITLIRTLLGTTRAAHTSYASLIDKYSAESPADYARRAKTTKLYGGLARTLSASVGMLFAKPPEKVDRWSPAIKAHWENIDGKKTHGDVFLKRFAEDAIADGFVGDLVDFPPAPEGVEVTSGNEESLNLRPFHARYQRADVLSWRTRVINNVEVPIQIVLREGDAVDDGEYGVALRLVYRILALVRGIDPTNGGDPTVMAVWKRVIEETSGSGRTVTGIKLIDSGVFRDAAGNPFDEIPFAVAYAGRTDAMFTANPPLLDVAWANWDHFRTATNLAYYEEKCCFPQPTVEGDIAKDANGIPMKFQVGPGVLVQVAAGSTFKFVELTGTSLDQLRQSLETKKQEIADLGMSFLAKQTRGVETAESKRLDATAENSTLATSAQGIEDGFNQALVYHARYLGLEAKDAPTIQINRDFENQLMESGVISAYVALVNAGFPKYEALEMLQRGGRIRPDANLEQLEAEWDAGLQAAEDQAAMEAEARMAEQVTEVAPVAAKPPRSALRT